MSQVAVGSPTIESGDLNVRRKAIFFASFMALVATGIGFAVRGAILGDWGQQFGFTKSDLGVITGGGLTGFGVTIIICSLFADRIGYKPLLLGAFVLHALSAIIILCATPVFASSGRDGAYKVLFSGCFMFALANGLCEAAINPLVATLYPKQKTHYLNILHAGWPGGLILGALFSFLFAGPNAAITHIRWEIPMVFFLVPTLVYGVIVVKEKFPKSETSAAGVSVGESIKSILVPLFIFLFLIHAMVGYVELGTDSWITNIMDNVLPGKGLLLFIYTSALMFTLRFFAGPIVHRINPLGLLFISACLGATGLFLLGSTKSGALIIGAATLFALGKTFYWPTMLGVAGERFPKGGALAMGLMGGIGMISAGMLGGPGIGYKQDRNASAHLKAEHPATYERYKANEQNGFLFFDKVSGLDGAKVAVVEDNGAQLRTDISILTKSGRKLEDDKNLAPLNNWWQLNKYFAGAPVKKEADMTDEEKKAAKDPAYIAERKLIAEKYPNEHDQAHVNDAKVYGGQRALQITAGVPVAMAVCYLLLVFYFMSKGGYKQIHVTDAH